MSSDQSKQVTILIPNFRTPEITKICLRLLRKYTDFGRVHVVVIDNDSQDASVEYLRTLKWIELLERKPEPGEGGALSHSRALDLALAQFDTPFVLSIHTDTFVRHEAWLDVLLESFCQDEKLAGVGPWKLESKSRLQRLGRKLEEFVKKSELLLTGRGNFRPERFDDSLHYLRSHCAMYRTDVIRSLSTGFSDGNEVAGSVMHRKMIEAGYRMLFLESDYLSRYVDHVNHATMILNPELGGSERLIRSRKKRVGVKLQGINATTYLLTNRLTVDLFASVLVNHPGCRY